MREALTPFSTFVYLFEGAEGARRIRGDTPLIWDSYAWAEVKAKLNLRERHYAWDTASETETDTGDETDGKSQDKIDGKKRSRMDTGKGTNGPDDGSVDGLGSEDRNGDKQQHPGERNTKKQRR